MGTEKDTAQATRPDWRADPDSDFSGRLRRRIIAAARNCLNEVGHDKLRMALIAREAGCSRATLYRYFSSREEILLHIAVENFQRINEEVDEEIARIDDLRLKLATGLARSMAVAHSEDVTHLFTTDMLQRAMSTHSHELSTIATERIGPIFAVAEKRGWVRPGVGLQDAVHWVIHASTGLLSMGWPVIGGRELGPDEQVTYLCRYLFYPILDMEELLD